MPLKRGCNFLRPDGTRCASTIVRDNGLCFFHDPTVAKEAAEARRLGGLRHRREGSVAGAYNFLGLDSVPAIRRVLEIATLDALAMENSLARSRTLVQLAMAAAKLLEIGEIEQRLEVLEETVNQGTALPDSIFDTDAASTTLEGEFRFLEPEPVPPEGSSDDPEDEPAGEEEQP